MKDIDCLRLIYFKMPTEDEAKKLIPDDFQRLLESGEIWVNPKTKLVNIT